MYDDEIVKGSTEEQNRLQDFQESILATEKDFRKEVELEKVTFPIGTSGPIPLAESESFLIKNNLTDPKEVLALLITATNNLHWLQPSIIGLQTKDNTFGINLNELELKKTSHWNLIHPLFGSNNDPALMRPIYLICGTILLYLYKQEFVIITDKILVSNGTKI